MEKNPKPAAAKPAKKQSKFRQASEAAKPSDKLREGPAPRTSGQVDPKSKDKKKPMTKEEKAAAKETRQIDNSKFRAEKSGDKLDKACEKLAAKKPYKPPGAVKKLSRAASAEVGYQLHSKIREVERDNVGVEAAHETELVGERTGRLVTRHVKRRIRTRPARQVKKAEKRNIKANADLHFREMAKENPELKKNALKRHMHKKRIQKQFQKQASEAAKKTGKEAVSLTAKAGRAAVNFIKKNPKAVALIAMGFLLVVVIQSCTAMTLSLFSGMGGGVVGGTTYLAEDADILAADAAYAGLEADLQYRLDNYAALNPGYDEYHFNLDEIGHDPFVLISILSAFQDGAWTFDDVQPMLTTLFDRQYILTETVEVEVRYRTETHTGGYIDDEGNSYSYSYTVEVPYDYYICTVTLENFNLSHLPIHMMSETQLSRYALYTATLGNRPDIFPVHLYPKASTYLTYETYDIPPAYLDADPVFAAMIAEANRYLGYPYIWGGYNPSTSFDCSGYVSWVINHSGWNVGRLGAQGLYGICSTVSSANARPGDLVFFHSTYNAPGITHVGIYVGDGMMVHAGNPIGYVTINTAYWQNHFQAFGRLP